MQGAFGIINIKTCTAADFTFTFKVGGAAHEMMQAPAPFYTASEDGGSATARATVHGVGADNPSDPMMLTPEQISRSVGFKYSAKSSFTVTLKVPCPAQQYNSGRNYMFAFHSSLTPCRI